jgi:predicted nucleic acid-binding protein
MRSLDTSYCFDFLRGDPRALERADEWEREGEELTIAAPAQAEFLRAGYRRGGRFLDHSLALMRRLEILPLDGAAAEEAARMGAECDRRGRSVASLDLLIAAVVRRNHGILVTRDRDFVHISGLQLEAY